MKKKEIRTTIKQTAKKLELRASRIANWLNTLATEGEMSNEDFTRLTGLPQTHSSRLLSEINAILEPPSKRVVVSREFVAPLQETTERLLTPTGEEIKAKIREKLQSYKSTKPKDKRKFDQFAATEETVAIRVVKMLDEGDVQQRSIILLGDNDLTSIGIALTREAKRITVLDIDKNVLRTIKAISQDQGLEIETLQHDLRDPLPSEMEHQFDTVFSDPPYTIQGVGTFINQAIKSMRQRFDARIYLCYGNSDRARERELPIQQEITNRGLLIHEKNFQFNSYLGARSIGSRSSLFLLDWTPKTKTTPPKGKRFYTNE
jgi:predicted RNA methylase